MGAAQENALRQQPGKWATMAPSRGAENETREMTKDHREILTQGVRGADKVIYGRQQMLENKDLQTGSS